LDTEEWNREYAKCVDGVQSRIPKIRGIVAAYNSNIDAIVSVRASDIERILKKDLELRRNIIAKFEKRAGEIFTKENLLVGLLHCIEKGTGEEWIINSRDVFMWVESVFKPDHLRIGGQAAIIANTLAKLNAPNVIVHASSLPEAQASLFLDNVRVPTKNNGRTVLENPMRAMRPDDEKMVHYVFEFEKGTRINVDKNSFKAPHANRFVATWDPKNNELIIDPAFFEFKIKDEADRAIISGYHLLSMSYQDGSTHVDKIARTSEQIRSWKEENREFFIHLEMGDNRYSEVYASTLSLLSPFIDSVGMNENELLKVSMLMKPIGFNMQDSFGAVAAFQMGKTVLENLKIPMILIHTSDFSLCIIRNENHRHSIRNVRDAILFGALAAAVRAITCECNDAANVKKEAANPILSLSPKGMSEHECLAGFLEKSCGASREDFLSKGYAELQDYDVIFVVSKLTEKPATTAGLGDTLVAGYILGVR